MRAINKCEFKENTTKRKILNNIGLIVMFSHKFVVGNVM